MRRVDKPPLIARTKPLDLVFAATGAASRMSTLPVNDPLRGAPAKIFGPGPGGMLSQASFHIGGNAGV